MGLRSPDIATEPLKIDVPREHAIESNDLRELKAQALRDASDALRRLADLGIKVDINTTLADRLADRAERIASGEDDHTGLPPETFAPPS